MVAKIGKMAIICTRCGSVSKRAQRTMQGSFLMECFLWLLFIVPGLIYSIWRLTTKGRACPACGSRDIVPLTTPMGQKLQRQFAAQPPFGDAEISEHATSVSPVEPRTGGVGTAIKSAIGLMFLAFVASVIAFFVNTTNDEQGREQQQKQRSADAFNKMTPAEHLSKAAIALKPGTPLELFDEALRNVKAVPPSSPEAKQAKILESKLIRAQAVAKAKTVRKVESR